MPKKSVRGGAIQPEGSIDENGDDTGVLRAVVVRSQPPQGRRTA
nr:hypothetical protein [Variovorax paradoxus]